MTFQSPQSETTVQVAPVSTILTGLGATATCPTIRRNLITEEWAYVWTWLAANPGNYGSPEDFPTLAQWLDRYVPSFTDFLGLIIDNELVAVGLLDEESYIHCLINPKCTKPFTRARLLKYSVLPYFAAKYRFLYTEIISRNKKAEKLVKYLGFEILPQSYTHPNRKVAIYRKR